MVEKKKLNQKGQLIMDMFREYRNPEISDISRIAIEEYVKSVKGIFDDFTDINMDDKVFENTLLKKRSLIKTKLSYYKDVQNEFEKVVKPEEYRYISKIVTASNPKIVVLKYIGMSLSETKDYFGVDEETAKLLFHKKDFVKDFVNTRVRKLLKEKLKNLKTTIDFRGWNVEVKKDVESSPVRNIFYIETDFTHSITTVLPVKEIDAIKNILEEFKKSFFA